MGSTTSWLEPRGRWAPAEHVASERDRAEGWHHSASHPERQEGGSLKMSPAVGLGAVEPPNHYLPGLELLLELLAGHLASGPSLAGLVQPVRNSPPG